ncbi:VOC family protein [Glutamicibacter sp. MNS18]|uniref:VOC family protein n=1 Tax=Glutamicibacter sp. MNS18 TaxID=2989817 RepID=UPI002236A5E0|nr:VOC family protein [Glutamicibacter sp. MNS18]MCW4465549.1 VOC family protein [Glutamicibacter sp. MNS18]
MEVVTSRVLLRPVDHQATLHFYREALDLPVVREFGPARSPGVVFQLGTGQLEISGSREAGPSTLVLWLQVRDVPAELHRLQHLGVPVTREARTEPWGLVEGWIRDPDGSRIVLVQIPAEHPLRRDQRGIPGS